MLFCCALVQVLAWEVPFFTFSHVHNIFFGPDANEWHGMVWYSWHCGSVRGAPRASMVSHLLYVLMLA